MDHIRKVTSLLCLCFLTSATALAAPSKVKVDGFGLFGNAELRNALLLLELDEGELTARKIDDAAFLLLSRLRQNGYLDAALTATYELPDGEAETVSWSGDFEPKLSKDVVAESLQFTVEAGKLYYYQSVDIDGVEAIEPEEAEAYFLPDTALYSPKSSKAYSPNIFSSQQKQLISTLVSRGYTDAKVTDSSVDLDEETGQVAAQLTVDEGRLYQVSSVETIIFENGAEVANTVTPAEAVYSRFWVEDRIRELRNESYRLGFPDTKVTSKIVKTTPDDTRMEVTVRFEVARGKKVILTEVEHRGATDTHLQLLNRKADLEPGTPLDISEVESARRSISRLGIFERIDLSYEPDGENGRKAIFDYKNGKRLEWQLLLGYGSYENLRGGILGKKSNLFGRAHSLSFEAIRSVKSTSGKLNYTIPELLGETIDGHFEANFLDRQELFFDRTERGVSAGLSKRLEKLNIDLGLDYAFDRKRSSDPQFNADLRLEDTNIGSLSLRASKSTVDNFLYPTSGYEISTAVRYAAEELGGETEFIRPEIGIAYHKRLGSRWIFHVATRAGAVSSPGENIVEIPYGERFLIGGENTLRGFRRGEAGPTDNDGIPIGAEAFALLNAELEYPLFDKLNLIVFADSARVWDSTGQLDDYEDFTNLGIGLRYKTFVGPVRLEYGRNLDPRQNDPSGTIHLSVGFPF